MIDIQNWNDELFTLDELTELADACDEGDQSFDELVDGDLATSPAIIRNLIKVIKGQEDFIKHLREEANENKDESFAAYVLEQIEDYQAYG